MGRDEDPRARRGASETSSRLVSTITVSAADDAPDGERRAEQVRAARVAPAMAVDDVLPVTGERRCGAHADGALVAGSVTTKRPRRWVASVDNALMGARSAAARRTAAQDSDSSESRRQPARVPHEATGARRLAGSDTSGNGEQLEPSR